jgi:hypothetical protein
MLEAGFTVEVGKLVASACICGAAGGMMSPYGPSHRFKRSTVFGRYCEQTGPKTARTRVHAGRK